MIIASEDTGIPPLQIIDPVFGSKGGFIFQNASRDQLELLAGTDPKRNGKYATILELRIRIAEIIQFKLTLIQTPSKSESIITHRKAYLLGKVIS